MIGKQAFKVVIGLSFVRSISIDTTLGYLLASAKRLHQLEAQYTKYDSVAGEEKKKLAKQLLAEIRKINRKHRKLASPAERPIAIGGNVRGAVKDEQSAFPDIDPIASEVSTSNFYGKTFTIDHK